MEPLDPGRLLGEEPKSDALNTAGQDDATRDKHETVEHRI
jgi:hypothetical protein